jgi:hypothetical protein
VWHKSFKEKGEKMMNAEQIKWWMDVFRKNVYTQLGVAVVGALFMGSVMLFHTSGIFSNLRESKGEIFLFGLGLFIVGLISCEMSGIAYDKIRVKLPAAETIERKEKDREKKHAAKSKKH